MSNFKFETNANPFIHGTDSSVLKLLPITNFTLFSPITMIENYGIAPEGGEITGGGLCSPHSTSCMAFGRVQNFGYSLDVIQRDYAVPGKQISLQNQIYSFKRTFEAGSSSFFSDINVLLIKLARLKQSGQTAQDLLTEADLQTFKSDLNTSLQVYYFLMLIGSELIPSPEISELPSQEFNKIFYENFSLKNLYKKFKDSRIDIKAIYESPEMNQAAISELIQLFKINGGNRGEVPLLTLNKKPLTELHPLFDSPYYYAEHVMNPSYGHSYNVPLLLIHIYKKKLDASFFSSFQSRILEIVKALEHRANLFENLLQRPSGMPSEEYAPFKNDHFPIIFVKENNENLSDIGGEYRAIQPLVFGEDIRIIATNSEENRIKIQQYLQHYQLHNKVQVLTFDELKNASNTRIPYVNPPYRESSYRFISPSAPKNNRMKILEVFYQAFKYNSPLMEQLGDAKQKQAFILAATEYKYALLEELSHGHTDFALQNAEAFAALNQPHADLYTLLPAFKNVLMGESRIVSPSPSGSPMPSKSRSAGAVCLSLLVGAVVGAAIGAAVVGILAVCGIPCCLPLAIGIISAGLALGAIVAEIISFSMSRRNNPEDAQITQPLGLKVCAFFRPVPLVVEPREERKEALVI